MRGKKVFGKIVVISLALLFCAGVTSVAYSGELKIEPKTQKTVKIGVMGWLSSIQIMKNMISAGFDAIVVNWTSPGFYKKGSVNNLYLVETIGQDAPPPPRISLTGGGASAF